MMALGVGVLWFGYGIASWGYLLVKGYDVTLGAWLSPLHPYSGSWPPPLIGDRNPGSVFPKSQARQAGNAQTTAQLEKDVTGQSS